MFISKEVLKLIKNNDIFNDLHVCIKGDKNTMQNIIVSIDMPLYYETKMLQRRCAQNTERSQAI